MWRREPGANGQGCIAVLTTDAYFLLRQGYLTLDGKRFNVKGINDVEDKALTTALSIEAT